MEEIDLKALVQRFDQGGFERGERIILGHFGTVQTLLSLIFNEPVRVDLRKQEKRDGCSIPISQGSTLNRAHIMRFVRLMVGERVVGSAISHIPLEDNRQDVLTELWCSNLGLGQIILKSGIPNKRILNDVARDDDAFSRTYTISGPQMNIIIRECFPRQPFEDVGWLNKGDRV